MLYRNCFFIILSIYLILFSFETLYGQFQTKVFPCFHKNSLFILLASNSNRTHAIYIKGIKHAIKKQKKLYKLLS